MRTGGICLVLCLLIGVVRAAAETPGYMSLYFEEEATTYSATPVPGLVILYACLTECPFPEITGYEFGFTIDGPALPVETQFRGPGAQATGTGVGYQVALDSPLPVEPVTVLAEIRLFVVDGSASRLILHGWQPESPDALWLPAVVLPGDVVQPVCTWGWDSDLPGPSYCLFINDYVVGPLAKSYECFGLVATEEMTWDAIKSMYR